MLTSDIGIDTCPSSTRPHGIEHELNLLAIKKMKIKYELILKTLVGNWAENVGPNSALQA